MLTAPQFSPARLLAVTERIANAARQAGREPAGVHLLAVSKQQPEPVIRAAAQAGQVDFGENYLQEALPKIDALRDLALTWHFIGHVQANKTRDIAGAFQWVHTVDSPRIAQRLSTQRPHHAGPLNVLLQVRLSDEPTKGGIAPGDVPGLAAVVTGLPRLHLRGLMCIPEPAASEDARRAPFRQLRELQQALRDQGHALDTLSMGMSDDLEAAVAEGATIVRVGTAVFGPRN